MSQDPKVTLAMLHVLTSLELLGLAAEDADQPYDGPTVWMILLLSNNLQEQVRDEATQDVQRACAHKLHEELCFGRLDPTDARAVVDHVVKDADLSL